MKLSTKKVLFILLIVVIILAIYFIRRSGITADTIDFNAITRFYEQNKITVIIAYFFSYILITAFSLPIATLITLIAGVVFGLWLGLLIVSFASAFGATLAFIFARYFFKDTLEHKYPDAFKKINQRIEQDGITYLLILRLVPIFPFFLINLLMGITRIRLLKFYIGSQIGMLPGTFIYLNAAASFREVRSLSELYTPRIIISIGLLILLIIATKIISNRLNRKS